MSAFTDDELRSLKRNVSTADRSKNTGGWFLSLAEWDALLARLEAAERLLRLWIECDDWRKASGK